MQEKTKHLTPGCFSYALHLHTNVHIYNQLNNLVLSPRDIRSLKRSKIVLWIFIKGYASINWAHVFWVINSMFGIISSRRSFPSRVQNYAKEHLSKIRFRFHLIVVAYSITDLYTVAQFAHVFQCISFLSWGHGGWTVSEGTTSSRTDHYFSFWWWTCQLVFVVFHQAFQFHSLPGFAAWICHIQR